MLCKPRRWGTKDDDAVDEESETRKFPGNIVGHEKPDARVLPGMVLVGAVQGDPRLWQYGNRHANSAIIKPMIYAPAGIDCASHQSRHATHYGIGTSLCKSRSA